MKTIKTKTLLPATALAIATLGTIFGSGGELETFKTTITTEGQAALSWVVGIVIALIGLYLLPVILRYLGVIVGAMRGAMNRFFSGRK